MAAHRRVLLALSLAALTAEAVVVKTTAALRAAADRQEATIRLGADLSLGGEPLIFMTRTLVPTAARATCHARAASWSTSGR